MAKSKTPLTVLSCLHTAYFNPPPRKGDVLFCLKCNEYKTAATAPRALSINCQDCSYTRHYGEAEVTAKTRASGHAFRHAGHRVNVLDGGDVVSSHYVEPMHMEVPNF